MTTYNMNLLKRFLRLRGLKGRVLKIVYERTVGCFKGNTYEAILKSPDELRKLQKHLGEVEFTADAFMNSEGYVYSVKSMEYL